MIIDTTVKPDPRSCIMTYDFASKARLGRIQAITLRQERRRAELACLGIAQGAHGRGSRLPHVYHSDVTENFFL